MKDVFLNLLGTSLVVGIASVVFTLVTPLWNRYFAARWKKRLWYLMALLLLIGAFLPFPEGTARVVLTVPQHQTTEAQPISGNPQALPIPGQQTALPPAQQPSNQWATGEGSMAALPPEEAHPLDVLEVAERVWLLGCAAMLLWLVAGEMRFNRHQRRWAKPAQSETVLRTYRGICEAAGFQAAPRLLICPGIGSPMLTGLLRPALLLPSEQYTPEEAHYIFRHELEHWRGHDLWWKLLFLAANAVHWFNPAVWLARREANREMERDCDERVVRQAGWAERRAYSAALLSAIHKGCAPAVSSHFNGGSKAMKERLENILSGEKRRGAALSLAAALLVVCLLPLVSCSSKEPSFTAGGTPAEQPGSLQTFLLVGTTAATNGCDTVMVLSYDTVHQEVAVMSLPRDTMVNVPWELKRLNSVYNYYGGGEDGLSALHKVVSGLLGFQPDHTIAVDDAGLSRLVDALGGVPFDVPMDMNYDDPLQGLSIHLKKGPQVLDGSGAVALTRWRKNNGGGGYANGDLGRIATQQALMQAVVKELLDRPNLTRLEELSKILKETVTTDLSAGELFALAKQAVSGGLTAKQVTCFTMPCEAASLWSETFQNQQSYVVPKAEELLDTVNRWFVSPTAPIALSDMDSLSLDAEGRLQSTSGRVEDGG